MYRDLHLTTRWSICIVKKLDCFPPNYYLLHKSVKNLPSIIARVIVRKLASESLPYSTGLCKLKHLAISGCAELQITEGLKAVIQRLQSLELQSCTSDLYPVAFSHYLPYQGDMQGCHFWETVLSLTLAIVQYVDAVSSNSQIWISCPEYPEVEVLRYLRTCHNQNSKRILRLIKRKKRKSEDAMRITDLSDIYMVICSKGKKS